MKHVVQLLASLSGILPEIVCTKATTSVISYVYKNGLRGKIHAAAAIVIAKTFRSHRIVSFIEFRHESGKYILFLLLTISLNASFTTFKGLRLACLL